MKNIVKIVVFLIGLIILANGLMFMFKPELAMGHSQIDANSTFGFSTIRGVMGGSMLATGLITLLALLKSKLELLNPVVIILLAWTFGRVVSLIMDGFDKGVFTSGILVSLIMAVLIKYCHKLLSREISK